MYLRKSRVDLEAETKEATLNRHESALWRLAKEQNLNVTKVYRELVSGDTISARPMMTQLLNEVCDGRWAGVLVMEVERLARGDSIDQGRISQAFSLTATKIITPSKTYCTDIETDQEYFEFGLFLSRREYKAINRRLQRGRLSSAREGKYIGSIPPYGYIRKKLVKQKGYTLEIDQQQAGIVKEIFDSYSKGSSMNSIANDLNMCRIPSAKGGKWSASSIKSILQNPVYVGKLRWNYRPAVQKIHGGITKTQRKINSADFCTVSDGLHEAIIDQTLWKSVLRRLQSNKSGSISMRTLKNPLAGLVVCGICGEKMIRRPHGDHGSPSLICKTPRCPTVGAKLSSIESKLLELLAEYYQPFQQYITSSFDDFDGFSDAVLKNTSADLAASFCHANTPSNSSTLAIALHQYIEALSRLTLNDANNKSNSNYINHENAELSNASLSLENLTPTQLYNSADDVHKKNQCLKLFISSAVYTKTRSSRWGKADFDLKISPSFVFPDMCNVQTNWLIGK